MGSFIDGIQIIDRVRSGRLVNEATSWGFESEQADETVYALLDELLNAFSATVEGIGEPHNDLARAIHSQTQSLA